MPRSARPLFLLCLSAVLGAADATEARAATPRPGERIVFLTAGAGAPVRGRALADAIRLQVADLGFVLEERPLPARSTLAERLRAVGALLEESGARLALWHEIDPAPPPAGESEVVLYVASPRRDATLVKVVRVTVRDDPAMYRALGLKVRELVLGALLLEGDAPPATAPPSGPAASAHPPAPAPAPAPAVADAPPVAALAAGWGASSLAGVSGLRHGAVLRPALRAGAWLDVHLHLAVWSAVHGTGASGAITLRETTLLAGMRAYRAFGRVEVGGALRAGARLLFATGVSERAGLSRAVRVPFAAGLEGDVRWRALRRLAVGLALGAELTLPRERFFLAGEELLAAGHVHFTTLLFVAMSAP